jgi:hypothetical protein
MAKESDSLAGGLDAGNTGGVLSGLLAEEDEFDRRTLWRLGSWAVASIGAVILAILANQSSIGMRREQIASADLARQSQQMQSVAKESQNEARRLASAIETLSSDRDRLYSRVAVLEQGLDSVTGAIGRQNSTLTLPQAAAPGATPPTASAASPAPATAPPAAAPSAMSASETPTAVQKSAAGPAVTPVAATAATTAGKPVTAANASEKPVTVAARAEPGSTATPSEPAASNVPTPATTLMASKSMMAPPDPAAVKLMEPSQPPKIIMAAPIPEVVASVPPDEEVTEADPTSSAPRLAVQRTEFGVDVGSANSIAGLRALWRGLLKSRSNTALTTLRPIIVIKEGSNGLGMQLRLVAGPINDAAAAAKICATMIANERACTTTVFEGQRLAINPDEAAKNEAKPASAGKPAVQRRQVSQRPVATEETAPKPEPSTLSSIFSRHQ